MATFINSMFPAHAGMNRISAGRWLRRGYVPRTRGDEPEAFDRTLSRRLCSPHTRG